MKKNVLKKFAAAALAAATVMSSMSVMAFADEVGESAETKGSVTITKYMSTSGAGATLSPEDYTGVAPTGDEYKLLKNVEFAYVKVGERVQVDTATSDSSQTEIQYTVTDENFLGAIGITTGANKNYTQSELNNKVSSSAKKTAVINFVKANKGTSARVTDGSGIASFTGLDLNALYVFAETNATNAVLASDGKTKVNVTKVSVPFLVSLPFTGKDGTTVKDLKVYPKNSTGEDTIDKKIVENGKDKTTTTANIGDTINYKVTYSIPVGENGLKSLVVTDTMSKGLTFADNVEVKNGTTIVDSENYKVVPDTNADGITTTTITFTENYCKKLPSNTTQTFTITYKATLNENAVLGKDGNTNNVIVKYTDKDDIERITDKKTTTVFTYGIDLLKKGEGEAKLAGVEFTLTDSTGKAVKVKKNDSDTFYIPGGESNTVTTDAGKIYIRGLKPGTYQLTETKTNAGYVLLKDPVVIVIKDDKATGDATATVGGKPVTMQNDQKNSGSKTAEVPLTVVNSKGFDLPATGGRGIALFTIAGIAIVAAAGSLLFMRKRSK